MKKTGFIILALLSLVGCKKDNVTTIFDFDVTVTRIESHKVWLDIIPKDEFLSYRLEYVSMSEWAEWGSDQAYVDHLNSLTTEELLRGIRQGAYMDALLVAPDSNYYVLITAMSGLIPTQVRKEFFTAGTEHINNFAVPADSIRIDDSGTISIHPSDTLSTYFWNYELKKKIDAQWGGYHSIWFFYDIVYYYQMDLLDPVPSKGFLSRGAGSENIFDYYLDSEVYEGDTICLMVVGYDATGETCLAYAPYWLVFDSNKKTSTAVEAEKDGWEDCYIYANYFTSPKRNTAKVASPIQNWLPESSFGRTGNYIPRHIRSMKR